MPQPKILSGTKHPDAKVTPSIYTDAQYKALEPLKQLTPRLKFGAARPEFVNHVLLADGTLSTDLAAVRSACEAAEAVDQAEYSAFVDANQSAVLHDLLPPADREQLIRLRGMKNHRRVEEFDDHVAQGRFLIVVDADRVPHVWFQCATPDNPDVELASDDDDDPSASAGPVKRLAQMATALVAVVFAGTLAALHALFPEHQHAPFLMAFAGTLDLSNVAANYLLDSVYDNKFPATSSLKIRTGAVAGAENADSGTVLSTIALPSSPWAAAASGSKAKQNTWQDGSAAAAGTAAHYRLTGTTTTYIEEGSVTTTGGGGDLTLDNTSIGVGQVVTVSTYTRTA